MLTTGSKGLGWYIASTGLIVLWGKETQYSYFYCNYPSGVDLPKCMKCPHFWQQSPGSSYTDMLVKFQGGNKTTLLYMPMFPSPVLIQGHFPEARPRGQVWGSEPCCAPAHWVTLGTFTVLRASWHQVGWFLRIWPRLKWNGIPLRKLSGRHQFGAEFLDKRNWVKLARGRKHMR